MYVHIYVSNVLLETVTHFVLCLRSLFTLANKTHSDSDSEKSNTNITNAFSSEKGIVDKISPKTITDA